MPDQLPPTTANDLDANSLSPCCNTRLELSSPPHGYECRNCMKEYDLSETATADADDDAVEKTMDTPRRVQKYVDEGKCGYYDPETMDSPCARSAGWGRAANDGPCSTHK